MIVFLHGSDVFCNLFVLYQAFPNAAKAGQKKAGFFSKTLSLTRKGGGVPERDCLGLREKIKKFQGLRDSSVTKVIALQEEGTEFDSQNPVLFCF